jgi:hypothetical protein
MPGRLPLPRAQSFVVCEAIHEDPVSRKCILVAPVGGLNLSAFPARFRLSLYADLCGCRGTFELALELRDDDLERIWGWQWPGPIRHPDPLEPAHVILHNAAPAFPRPGRYDLVLLANRGRSRAARPGGETAAGGVGAPLRGRWESGSG